MFDLSDAQIKILATLQAFRRPISLVLTAQLSHLSESQMEAQVRPLREKSWLREHAGFLKLGPHTPDTVLKSLLKQNTKERLSEILKAVKAQDPSQNMDIFAIFDFLLEAGEIEQSFLLAWESIRSDIRGRRYENASELSAWVSSKIEAIAGRTELGALPVDLVLTFSSLAHFCRKYHAETVTALEGVLGLCRQLGDERRLALVFLQLGLFYMALHQMQKSFENFGKGFAIVERLGDLDIKERAAPFYCYYYLIQGHCSKALIHFERTGHWEFSRGESVPDPQLTASFGIQAALAGQFHHAIGALNASWRRAVVNGDHKTAGFYRAFLGQVLLLSGQLDEAILHLNAAIEAAEVHSDAFTQIWAERAKAYYLFQLGRGRESYEVLQGALEKSSRHGWSRPYYALPWVLELLYYFHQNGYPPIHGYEFQAEMENALAGPNIQLRGTAFRIRADLASQAGEGPEVVRDLLGKSERDLVESGNPFELAKTRAQIALLFQREGNQTRARELALQAWEALYSVGDQALPPEIRSLIGDTATTALSRSSDREVMDRFLDMMDAWIPSANRDEVLHRVILATTRFFRAERGAIFLLEGVAGKERLVFYKGCNLTRDDMAEGDLQTYLKQAAQVVQGDSPMIIREPVSDSALPTLGVKSILCIPFSTGNGEHGLLYYDTIHRYNAFDWCDNASLSRITESIGTHLQRIWEYSQRLNRQSRLIIPAATELPEQGSDIFITSGDLFQRVIRRADRAAASDAPVLILGETGSGKEVIAKRIHAMSNRRNMPFIAVNLASIPETLVESELFGHEKGAFTGADRQKLGRMELANKGTLFIDEVGDIPKSIQVKLLRALEEMSFVRIGGVIKREVDFRLITATNRILTKEVEAGNFRSDLFYRLNVIPIFIPPLRQRGDDVIELAQAFLEQFARKYRQSVQPLSPEVKATLKAYPWPGNVRELRNVMERAIVLNNEPGRSSNPVIELLPHSHQDVDPFADQPTLDEVQRRYIARVLENEPSLTNAAVILGMKRTSLYKRMIKLGLR